MSSMKFIKNELAGAIARGVRQFVVIGSRAPLPETLESSPDPNLQVFSVSEAQRPDSAATFVPTQFASEPLAAALEKSNFDRMKASLFVWIGGAYRSFDAAMASLAFIASLPTESGVVFDYSAERTSPAPLTDTALDALASRICGDGGSIKHLIQPQAVAAMLRGFGFRKVVDLAQEEVPASGAHLVSAMI